MDKTEESKPKGWFQGLIEKAEQAIEQAQSFAHARADATKALESLLRKAWNNQKELRILVTGKTGQGKSTLINGILGDKVVAEGARASRCTTKVEMFPKTIHGVPIKVFDSPGLQDCTKNEAEYIQGMIDQCQQLSLVLYCMKMVNTRLTDDDKHAMVKLTKAFGKKFWEYAVFVLTFANMENCNRKDDRDEDMPEPDYDDEEGWKALIKQRFEGRLKIWEEELKKFFIDEVGVSPDVANRIPVVPTGDHKITRDNLNPLVLPDRDDWFNKFWKACCLRVKETRLFLEINRDRMVICDDDGAVDRDEEIEKGFDDTEAGDIGSGGDDSPTKELQTLQAYQEAKQVKVPPPVPPKPVKRRISEHPQESESKPIAIGGHSDSQHKPKSRPSHHEEVPKYNNPESSITNQKPKSTSSVESRDIYIDNEFAKEIAAESVRRRFGPSAANAFRAVINDVAKPGKWLVALLKKINK